MTDHKFIIPVPVFPSFRRYLWQVCTLSLIRETDRRAWARTMLYVGALCVATTGLLTAVSETISYSTVLLAMLLNATQMFLLFQLMDQIEYTRRMNEWECKEARAAAEAYLARVRKEAAEVQLDAVEKINAHARVMYRKVQEERRKVDGEDWRQQ